MPPRYLEWLQFVFNRPVTPNGWYFDSYEDEFNAANSELVELFQHTMVMSGQDLSCYSDEQVKFGLEYIFNNSCSDVPFSLKDDAVPIEKRLQAIESIKFLYRNCFSPRCAHVLSHNDEPGANPINAICYMLWDVSPLSYWERSTEKHLFYPAVINVLEDALFSTNPACIESGLHGLGHVHPYFKERVVTAIELHSKKHGFSSPQLKQYAHNAAIGYVQ